MFRPSSNPAHSGYIKARRAKININALRKEILETRFVSHHGVRFAPNYETGVCVMTLSHAAYRTGWGVNQVGPRADIWPAVVGEIVHDLRSALDHLAFQLSATVNSLEHDRRHAPSTPGKWRRIAFPVFIDETKFIKDGMPRLWALEKTPFHSFISQQQPFAGAKKAPEKEPLWILDQLWTIDKHRSLSILGGLAKLKSIRFSSGINLLSDDFGRWAAYEKGSELGRFTLMTPLPDGDIHKNYELAFDVALNEQVANGQLPLIETLDSLRREVIRVLDEFQEIYYAT